MRHKSNYTFVKKKDICIKEINHQMCVQFDLVGGSIVWGFGEQIPSTIKQRPIYGLLRECTSALYFCFTTISGLLLFYLSNILFSGAERYSRDIEMMIGRPMPILMRISWCVVTPIVMLVRTWQMPFIYIYKKSLSNREILSSLL